MDLPGYGYAKQAKTARLEWAKFSQTYFLERETLASVFLLIDASVPPQAADVECAVWLAGAAVPFAVVLTKADKKKRGMASPAENVDAIKAALGAALGPLPPLLATSAETGAGREAVLTYIAQLRALFWQGVAEGEAGGDGGRAAGGAAAGKAPGGGGDDDDFW